MARLDSLATRVFGALALLASTAIAAQQIVRPPPNLVVASERITTSGQPSKAWLGSLKEQGFEAVVQLVSPADSDAVQEEPLVVSRQGLIFVSLPISFEGPTERDFGGFAEVMRALPSGKVLVHCRINLHASSMVFLYRTILLKEDSATAYEAVAKVWVPEGTWKRLIQDELRKNGVNFEPF
jgi:protein tyrosine phosphatase (PTP) superfamily phosphohydrolase (DUF442 family)